MTNAFEYAKRVEHDAVLRLKPLFSRFSDNGQFIMTEKGPLAKQLQEMIGDVAMNRNGDVMSIELKAEAVCRGNFFFEEWSNYPTAEAAAPNPGWARKTNATFIWYYFLDTDLLWIFRRIRLQWWLYGSLCPGHDGRSDEIAGGAVYNPTFGIKQKVQKKYSQLNTTTGFIVPIALVEKCLQHKRIAVSQYLIEAAA